MDAPSTEKTGLHKGDVIDGKLEIEGVIGEGRISAVVAAIDRETNERVAVKVLRVSDLESIERFRRAARGMAKLTSRHAIRVLRVGETQDGSPCMTMEYLEGKPLSQHLVQRGALPIDEATRWMLQACEAIADAHAVKLLHRDVDAENLFLSVPKAGTVGQPSIRVLDFGLAPVWRLGKGDGRTKPGEVPGTSLALAPEIARGSDFDERIDIWGIGACLYRLLTNRYPFSARNLAELCTRVLGERAPDVTKVRPEVSPALAAVITRCLEREPGDRYRSVQDVIAALSETRDDAPNTPQVPTEQLTLDQLRTTPRAQPVPPPSSADDETVVFQGISQSAKRTPKIQSMGTGPQLPKVELPPPSIGAPETIRTAPPAFDALATQLEPAKKKLPSTKPPPKVQPPTFKMPTPAPPPPDPPPEDGPSTQPLGRLSPFADPPSSDVEHTMKPQLSPMTLPHPLPKPSPQTMAQETIQGPGPLLSPAPPPPPPPASEPEPEDPTAMMVRPPLPKPSPALQAQETIPRGLEAPKPSPGLAPTMASPVYEPPPELAPTALAPPIITVPPPSPILSAPPSPIISTAPPPMTGPPAPLVPYPKEEPPRKGRAVAIALVFMVGIAASIAIGLYIARATMPASPPVAASPSASVSMAAPMPAVSSANTTGPADEAIKTTAPTEETEPTLPVASVSASAPATVRHHHHPPPAPRPQPQAQPAPSPAPSKSANIYDPNF